MSHMLPTVLAASSLVQRSSSSDNTDSPVDFSHPVVATAVAPKASTSVHIEFTGWRPERRYRPGRVERDISGDKSSSSYLFNPDANHYADDNVSLWASDNVGVGHPLPVEQNHRLTSQLAQRVDKTPDGLKESCINSCATPAVCIDDLTMANAAARKEALEFLKFQASMSDAWVCHDDDDDDVSGEAAKSPTSDTFLVSNSSEDAVHSSALKSDRVERRGSFSTADGGDNSRSSFKSSNAPVIPELSRTVCDSGSGDRSTALAVNTGVPGTPMYTVPACNSGSQYKRKLGLQRLVLQGATTAKIPGLGSVIQTSGHQFIPNPGKSLNYAKTGAGGIDMKNSAESRLSLEKQREEKFELAINSPEINLEQLQQLAWSGIPSRFRARVWKLLVGYVPLTNDENRRTRTLMQKRAKYDELIQEHFPKRLHAPHNNTFRQIHIDIPRMSLPVFQQPRAQELFERILFIWAIQNPQCGYVQGINDLLTPYFFIYLQDMTGDHERLCPSRNFQLQTALNEDQLQQLETDCYWSLVHLLANIGDYYTFAQPGIQRNVEFLKDLLQRVDNDLYEHLFKCQVEFLHFSFRWMNNLLIRELPFHCVVRLWDTLLTEPEGFSTFIVYVCASFMCMWSKELQEQPDFQSTLLLLQNLPTASWGDNEVRLLVADAFRLRYTYEDALSHLKC